MNPTPLFPDRPIQWLVRGTYRAPPMRGHSCSAIVYTRNRGHKTATAAAIAQFPWMRIASVRLVSTRES